MALANCNKIPIYPIFYLLKGDHKFFNGIPGKCSRVCSLGFLGLELGVWGLSYSVYKFGLYPRLLDPHTGILNSGPQSPNLTPESPK